MFCQILVGKKALADLGRRAEGGGPKYVQTIRSTKSIAVCPMGQDTLSLLATA